MQKEKPGLGPGFFGFSFCRVLFDGLDAVGADLHFLSVYCPTLQIDIKSAAGLNHRVAARNAHLGSAAALFTGF